jgi:hypothetical protein
MNCPNGCGIYQRSLYRSRTHTVRGVSGLCVSSWNGASFGMAIEAAFPNLTGLGLSWLVTAL